MKKFYLSLGAAFIAASSYGQVQRMVLAEAFSNASCGPCAAQNPGYNTILGANTTKVIAIKYQADFPGFDPMNVQNPAEVDTRLSYYAVSGVPEGHIDGTKFAGPNYLGALANLDQTEINNRYAVTSPFELISSHTFSSDLDSIFITIDITTPAAFNSTQLKLHVAMVEETIEYPTAPGSNGETVFHSVMRKMYPNAGGTTLGNSWTAAQTQQVTFAVAVPSYIYDLTQVRVVAFIQTDSNKEVFQAALSNPAPVSNYGKTESIAGLGAIDCDGDIDPTVQLKNLGSNTITTATVNYRIDALPVLTAPFAGSITSGGTANFNIPSITGIAGGGHTITTWLTNVNGSGSTAVMGEAESSFNIAAAPGAAPVTQGFETWTPANWIIDNSATTQGWMSQTYGGFAASPKSAMCFFWLMAPGQVADIYSQRVNLTGVTTPGITFDVAYTYFTAASPENDRLEVLVSDDCGATWTSVYDKAGTVLQTAPPVGNGAANGWFKPDLASEWRQETISLASFVNASDLMVRFKGTSAYGDNLFIDNINIGTASVGVIENPIDAATFGIFPNPATDVVNVNLTLNDASDVNVSVMNAIGQVVITKNLGTVTAGTSQQSIDVNGLAAGAYVISVNANGTRINKTFIKK